MTEVIPPKASPEFAYSAMNKVNAELAQSVRIDEDDRKMLVNAAFTGLPILMEAGPGVGKTTIGKALARAMSGDFKRIQGAPDLLPSDITGGLVYNPQTGDFNFREGPVFGDVVLIDEGNRMTEKTHAATIEPLEEKTVTVDGKTYKLPESQVVIITQNPNGHDQGTFFLPNQIKDRIGMSFIFPEYDAEQTSDIVELSLKGLTEAKQSLCSIEELNFAARGLRQVTVDKKVIALASKIQVSLRELSIVDRDESVLGGARPALAMARLSRAIAVVRSPKGGMNRIVEQEDIVNAASYVLPHRFELTNAEIDKKTPKSEAIRLAIRKALAA